MQVRVSNYFKPVCLPVAATVFIGLFSGWAAVAGDKSVPQVPKRSTVYDAPNPLPHGKHGDLIWATEIKTEIPGARLEIMANAGHFPHWEQPRDFADRVIRFADRN